MGTLATERVIAVLLDLFAEAYKGPSGPHSWFLDNRPDVGLFATLAGLTAEIASRPVGTSGLTIAAHAEHLRWSLALANAIVRGEMPQFKWQESWSVRVVDAAAWEKLQSDLRQDYETLHQRIGASVDMFKPEWLQGVMALVPHAAYHLGAIRQMAGSLRG